MKKLLAVVLTIVMVLSVMAVASADEMRVAMITDYGDITDQSFNQTTYEAAKAWCDANGVDFTYYKPAGDSTAERVAMVEKADDDGYNVIIMPGYAFGGTIAEVAADYPDVKFVALDVAAGDILEAAVALKGETYDYNPDNWNMDEYADLSNVYCAVYQEELCGYMAGYAAVKLGYEHLGFLGGMAVPAVVRYGYGFVQGANAAAEELEDEDVTVEYVYGNQFYGDADITAYMDNWYSNLGVEVVFACGGGIFTSAAEAAAKVDGKVIGVDVDQAALIDGNYGEDMTVTSAMKGLGATVFTLLTEIKDGNWDEYAGKIETLGLIGEDPELNYVQIAPSTQFDETFTEEDYEALVKRMYEGDIIVDNSIDEMPEVDITVNDLGTVK
ncbi:MAG: BMP family ABC transporter substrate-binding protein [Anaerolineaceae bacterium]|nr:BMP family ABC transporter substrate-binding protein [Anaerolineaceae bacterium]